VYTGRSDNDDDCDDYGASSILLVFGYTAGFQSKVFKMAAPRSPLAHHRIAYTV
jgi:hypothetical protein